ACGVLSIGNHRVKGIMPAQHRHEVGDSPATRFAHDVANEQESHGQDSNGGLPGSKQNAAPNQMDESERAAAVSVLKFVGIWLAAGGGRWFVNRWNAHLT